MALDFWDLKHIEVRPQILAPYNDNSSNTVVDSYLPAKMAQVMTEFRMKKMHSGINKKEEKLKK